MRPMRILLLSFLVATQVIFPFATLAQTRTDTSLTGDCPEFMTTGRIRLSVYIPGITEKVEVQQSLAGKIIAAGVEALATGGYSLAGKGLISAANQLGRGVASTRAGAGLVGGATAGSAATRSAGTKICYYLRGGLQDYVKGLYNFGVGVGGFLAALMIMIGGAQWIMAGGSPEKISKSKERMINAIVGLLILLVSYTMLSIVNPKVLILKGPDDAQKLGQQFKDLQPKSQP